MADQQALIPPAKAEANTSGPAGQQTCFVVIGFGRKTDFATDRLPLPNY